MLSHIKAQGKRKKAGNVHPTSLALTLVLALITSHLHSDYSSSKTIVQTSIPIGQFCLFLIFVYMKSHSSSYGFFHSTLCL